MIFGEISKIPDEGYVASPKYTSKKQKIEEQKVEARKKDGLTETIQDPKAAVGELSLNYMPSPKINTYTELKKQRNSQMIVDLKSLEAGFENVTTAE